MRECTWYGRFSFCFSYLLALLCTTIRDSLVNLDVFIFWPWKLLAAFFYCEIDGSSLCLQCDMVVHVGGKRTHKRYLLLRQRFEVGR